MKYVNECSLPVKEQSATHKGVAQKFAQISSRLPVSSKRKKCVFEVSFRILEFHHARMKKKMYISS